MSETLYDRRGNGRDRCRRRALLRTRTGRRADCPLLRRRGYAEATRPPDPVHQRRRGWPRRLLRRRHGDSTRRPRITTADFNAIAAHLEAPLEAFEVGADDRDAVLAAVGEYEDDIVTVTV